METIHGLTINLLRDSLQQDLDINVNNREATPHILWSDYDRIDVKETDSFKNYFEFSFNPNNWIGDVQSLYLYPLTSLEIDETQLCVCKNDGDRLFSYRKVGSEKAEKYLFFSIVTVKISKELSKSFYDSLGFIKLAVSCLSAFTTSKNVFFKPFFSLGTEDVVFIFLGNRISDIIKSIYFLRKIQLRTPTKKHISFCSTTYSVMGQNCHSDYFSSCDDIESMAQVLLTLKEGKRASDFKARFFDCLGKDKGFTDENFSEMLIGEYDIQFTAKASKFLWSLYLNDGVFTAKAPIYDEFILRSKTVWYLENKALQKENYPLSIVDIDTDFDKPIKPDLYDNKTIGEDSNRNVIQKLQRKVDLLSEKIEDEKRKNCKKDLTKSNDNLIAVYQDILLFTNELIKIMSSCSHADWFERLANIAIAFDSGIDSFLMTMTMESSVIEINHRSFEQKVLEINHILVALRNALSHIHKSGEHFYNVPHPSIYYSGSAHKVLMAYYNFIELVLSLGYLKPHAANTKQSRISFFITFGMINKVKTQIYFKTSTKQENRLVGFELPYAALYDFKKYIPALLHEVYHLIAPTNREERNKLLLGLWAHTNIRKYLIKYLKQFLDKTSSENEAQEKSVENILQILIDKFLQAEYKILLDIYFRNLNGYYNTRMGLANENILALDQEEFVRVLNRFYDDKSYSILISFILTQLDQFLTNETNKKNIISFFKANGANKNVTTYLYRIIRRIKAQQKDTSIKNKVSEERIGKTWEEKYHIAIKETVCDSFFVDLLQWSLKDYLSYMLDFFLENRVEWSEVFYQEISVRLGTMICYFYGDSISDANSVNIKEMRKWFENQLELCNFSATNRKELLKIFSIYTGSYFSLSPLFLSLLSYETIKATFIQIEDEQDSVSFVQKAIKVKSIYESLSQNNLSQQLKGILFLQDDFSSMPKKNKLQVSYKVTYPTLPWKQIDLSERITTGDLGYFLALVSEIKNVYKNENEELWFRGVCNSTYKLIPSLFRQLPEVSKTISKPFVAYGYQVAMIRQAYLQTKTFYSLMEKNEKPLAVRQAFLQHYGIQTNFLDFSTDPLSSLYWALNPDNDEDQKNKHDAIVYVFAPEKYQKAVNKIKATYNLLTKEEANYLYPYHTHNCLSDEYVINDMSDEHTLYQVDKAKQYQDRVNVNKRYKYNRMPLVTVVPQKNDRILAQSGCFVAYNLLSAVDYDETPQGSFDYLSLECIQTEYIRICNEEGVEAERFLYRILIPVVQQNKLNRAIETIFGYSLAKVYPDVDKLFTQANLKINKYFKNLQPLE